MMIDNCFIASKEVSVRITHIGITANITHQKSRTVILGSPFLVTVCASAKEAESIDGATNPITRSNIKAGKTVLPKGNVSIIS